MKMTVVRPAGVTGALPVFMFFHGGGWVLGDFPTHERLVRDLAVGSGAAAVFVDFIGRPPGLAAVFSISGGTAPISTALATRLVACRPMDRRSGETDLVLGGGTDRSREDGMSRSAGPGGRQAISYPSTMLFHMVPAVTATSTRLLAGAPANSLTAACRRSLPGQLNFQGGRHESDHRSTEA